MEHKLTDIARDFSWTKDEYGGWFDCLYDGWADVLYKGINKLDKVLKKYNLTDNLYIVQVKEKFGGLRFYYDFVPEEDKDFSSWQAAGIRIFDDIVWRLEEATEKVCCDCGTTEDVQCYGGWVHFACSDCEAKKQAEWNEGLKAYNKYREGK